MRDDWLSSLAAQDAYLGDYPDWQRPSHEPEGPPTPIHLQPNAWALGQQAARDIQNAPLPQLTPAPGWAGNVREIGGRMGALANQAGTGAMEAFQTHLGRAPPWQEDLTGSDPGTRELQQQVMTRAIAARPQPQDLAEEWARSLGRPFGDPLSYAGMRPGAALAWNLATGVGSEAARQAYKDTPAEKYAAMVGGAAPFVMGHILSTGGPKWLQ